MTVSLPLLATLADFGGSLVVGFGALTALSHYLRSGGAPGCVDSVRLTLAQTLVFALSLKIGAGLIRTVTVGSWGRFVTVFSIIALRFLLGRVLKSEGRRSADRVLAR